MRRISKRLIALAVVCAIALMAPTAYAAADVSERIEVKVPNPREGLTVGEYLIAGNLGDNAWIGSGESGSDPVENASLVTLKTEEY